MRTRTAITISWCSCRTMRPQSAVAAVWRTRHCGERELLRTCSCGPAATSNGGPMSLPRCRPRSCARANFFMPHDPELVAETRAWLAKAWLDLAAAEHELIAEPPFVEDIVF